MLRDRHIYTLTKGLLGGGGVGGGGGIDQVIRKVFLNIYAKIAKYTQTYGFFKTRL